MKKNRLRPEGFPDDLEMLCCRSVRRERVPGDGDGSSVFPGQANRPYLLVFEEDTSPEPCSSPCVVRISSPEDAAVLFGILGRNCELHVSPEYLERRNGLSECISGLSYREATDAMYAADMEHVHDLLRKLPLNISGLVAGPLALTESDPLPPKVERGFVHKKNGHNTLLSEPVIDGRLVHFNLIGQTGEFVFDHDSDHLQGMLLLEAIRQASIAVTHIAGDLPLSGMMALSSYYNSFSTYVERSAPVVLRAFTSYRVPSDGRETDDYAICQVFQWGKLVAEACLQAVVFMNHEQYDSKRVRAAKISQRSKRQFDGKISALLENHCGI